MGVDSDDITIKGLVGTNEPRELRADLSTHTLQTIDYTHHEIHAGSHFYYTDKNEIASAGTQLWVISTTAMDGDEAHMLFAFDGSAITQFDIYEDTTRTGTTDVATFNSNRNSTSTADLIVYKGASTDGADGTLVWTYKGGAASAQSKAGATSRSDGEKILKDAAKYLIRYTSGTNNNLTNLILNWYEHTPKT
jgi:hypothetical protein